MKSKDNIKVGIIGYGKIGKIYGEVLKSRNIQIIICDPISDTFIQDFKDSVLLECEIIIVCSPPNLHFEIASYFAEKNKFVVIEKPPVISITELEQLKKYSDLIYCSYHTAFNPIFEGVKNQLDTAEKIAVTAEEYIFNYHKKDSWIINPEISGGGCLIDNVINVFSVLLKHIQVKNIYKVSLKKRFLDVEDMSTIILDGIGNNGQKVELNIHTDWFSQSRERRRYSFEYQNVNGYIDLATGQIFQNGIDLSIDALLTEGHVNEKIEYNHVVADFLNVFEGKSSVLCYDKFAPIELVLNCYEINNAL